MSSINLENIKTQDISQAKFACIDTETTGLSPLSGGKLCEIAITITQNGKNICCFDTLINPSTVIGEEVIKIHGITNEMVADKPRFYQQAPKILSILEDCVIVCHNAEFDISFLSYELAQSGFKLGSKVILDTLLFARKHGEFSKNRLGVIVKELGFNCDGWHRALNDAKMTELIFYHFVKKFIEQGARTVGDLEKLQIRKSLQKF